MKNMKNKDMIRKEVCLKRKLLPTDKKNKYSQNIFEKLRTIDEYFHSKNIMFYVATKYEVQTENMIKESIKGAKNIFIPIMNNTTINLVPSLLIDFDKELEKNKQGILEPKKEFQRISCPEKIDLIILPGIAFDTEGNRLGRGKGYYDRFLERANVFSPKIALAFECQIIEKIPVDDKDIPVDTIITEKRIIRRF